MKTNSVITEMYQQKIISLEEKELFNFPKEDWNIDDENTQIFYMILKKLILFQKHNENINLNNIHYPIIEFDESYFNFTHYNKEIWFNDSYFYGDITFKDIVFLPLIRFIGNKLFKNFYLNKINFKQLVDFSSIAFNNISLQNIKIENDFLFCTNETHNNFIMENIEFTGNDIIFDSEFYQEVYLKNIKFASKETDFSFSIFHNKLIMENIEFQGETDFSSIIFHDALITKDVKNLEKANWEFSHCILREK